MIFLFEKCGNNCIEFVLVRLYIRLNNVEKIPKLQNRKLSYVFVTFLTLRATNFLLHFLADVADSAGVTLAHMPPRKVT